jgi:predicted RND superfamily exporter protein/glutaredoxin
MANRLPRVDIHARITNWARQVGRYQAAVLIVATVLTVASVFVTRRLSFNTDLADLLPPDNPDLKILRRIQAKYASDTGFMVLLSKNYVFAAQADGTVQMHNGRVWRRWKLRSPVQALHGLSAADLFAVGDGGAISRYQGKRWAPERSGTTRTLRGVWGDGPRRFFAVGDGGTALGYDGRTWSRVATGTDRDLRAISGAGEDIFAVGAEGTILRWQDGRFVAEDSGTRADLLGVFALGQGEAFAVGKNGTFLRRHTKDSGGRWSAVPGHRERRTLRSVWARSPEWAIAVGDGGLALHLEEDKVTTRQTGAAGSLKAVHGRGARDVWVVGDACAIKRWDLRWVDGPYMSWEEHQRRKPGVWQRIFGTPEPPPCLSRFTAVWRPPPAMDPVKAFAPRLAALLERSPNISRVDYKKPVGFFLDRALYYSSVEDLGELRDRIEERLERETAKGTGLYVDLEEDRGKKGGKELARLADRLRSSAASFGFGESEWYQHQDGTSIGVAVFPQKSGSNLENLRRLREEIRGIVDRSGYREADPLLRVDITGDGVDKIREYDASVNDIFALTPYAIGGIILLMMLYFRSWLGLIFVVVPLGMSIAWTFAITTLAIGTLNLVTGFLFAVLFGLGIDYGLQLFARYREGRRAGLSVEDAKSHMVLDTGRATLTSALTTSAALLTLTVTDFRGFSEFGFIAGIGVLLAMASFILVMPALISLAERLRLIRFRAERWPSTAHTEREAPASQPFALPRVVLVGSVLLVPLAVYAAVGLSFEYNTRKLRPKYHEDEVERRSGKTLGRSFTPTLMLADSRAELDAAVAALRRKKKLNGDRSTIRDVASILSFIPARQREKRVLLEELSELLEDKRWNLVSEEKKRKLNLERLRRMARARPFDLEDLPKPVRRAFRGPGFGSVWLGMVFDDIDLADLRQAERFKQEVGTFEGAKLVNLESVVPAGAEVLAEHNRAEIRCPDDACVARAREALTGLRSDGKPVFQEVLGAREAYRRKLAVAGALRGQLLAIARPGEFLLRARGATHDTAVEPSGTFHVSSGEVVLAEVVEVLLREGKLAFALAFGTILIAAMLDFRSVKLALLATLPLLVGFVWTFGAMQLVGLKVNLFNFVILPALLGIGIDYGVHYVHRYDTEGPGSLGKVMRALYWVIFFCAMTSVVGFGNVALAAHPGLKSLGQVAIIGLVCIFFASTYTLPSVLYVIDRRKAARAVPRVEVEPAPREVVVYTVSYCPACRLLCRLLTHRKVEYTCVEVDTLPMDERQRVADELTEQAGSANLPVTRVAGRYLTGFDPGQLTALLSQLEHGPAGE